MTQFENIQIRCFCWSVLSSNWNECGDLLWKSGFSSNKGKYRSEKTPYLGNFHAATYTDHEQFVDNKAKERISKRTLEENKARQIYRKTNISYPMIRTSACVYQGLRNSCFTENWVALFPYNTCSEIRPFVLFPKLLRRILKRIRDEIFA